MAGSFHVRQFKAHFESVTFDLFGRRGGALVFETPRAGQVPCQFQLAETGEVAR